ncbi:MAG: glycosyltransferase [Candidatus Thiodiazotropha endolucinida]
MPYLGDRPNSIDHLNEAIDSVMSQTEIDWHLIIIDDGAASPLDKGCLSQSFLSDKRLRILRTSNTSGPGVCRNIGVQHAYDLGSPFVLYLDSDDVASSDRLELTRAAFEDSTVGLVYSAFSPIDNAGYPIEFEDLTPSVRSILENIEKNPPSGRDVWLAMSTETGYSNLTSTTSVRTDLALLAPFPSRFVSEDFHTWLRIGALGPKFLCLPNNTCRYRIWGGEEGSSTRSRFGGKFYRRKAMVDSEGFEAALRIALGRGRIGITDTVEIRKRFVERLAVEMQSEGDDELSEFLTSLSISHPLDEQIWNIEGCGQASEDGLVDVDEFSSLPNVEQRENFIDRAPLMKGIAEFAQRSVPFYKDHWGGVDAIVASSGNLREFPFVLRQHVSHKMLDLCSDDIPQRRIFRHRSSGTTGEPVTGLMDYHDWHMNLLSIVAQLRSLGLEACSKEFGEWCFMQVTVYPDGRSVQIDAPLPNRPVWRRLNIPAKKGARDQQLEAIVTMLAVFEDKPCVLNGMPSVLLRVGEMVNHYFPEYQPNPIMVLTSGEALNDDVRSRLIEIYGVEAYSLYSAGEVGCVGYECREKNGFHLESNRLQVQIDSDNGPGEVIVTTLENRAMPLIRYRTGDYAAIIAEPCACGDPRVRIGPIIGRSSEDYQRLLDSVTAV